MKNSGLLPNLNNPAQKDLNWHGTNGKFSSHYYSKFYEDNSLSKAFRQTQYFQAGLKKELLLYHEIQKIERTRHVLLSISDEKAKFEKIKKKVLTEKKTLEKKFKNAAVIIQKNIRGFLSRVHHEDEMAKLKKVKLGISVKVMKKHVGKCCIFLDENIIPATIVIQKYMRRHLAIKLLKKMKSEDKASRVITRFFRVIKNRSKFRKNFAKLLLQKKLKEIKKRAK